MNGTSAALLIPIGVLALGTFAIRFAGVSLQARIVVPDSMRRALTAASVILLLALVATSTLFAGQSFAGWSRIAGVLVGGALAHRRLPFVVVVIGAAVVTAGLRWCGVR